MELDTNSKYNPQEIIDINAKLISSENLKYLYPNGHRMTHQMRWYKGSRDRGLSPDIAAWKTLISYILIKEMKKSKKHQNSKPEPYEDMIRLEQLDPYEALIKSNYFFKKK